MIARHPKSVALVACLLACFQPSSRADCPLEESGHWGGTVTEMIDHNGLLYAAIGRRLDVIDASNPSEPRRVGQLPMPGPIRSLALDGQTAYTISYDTLSVIDVSDPARPMIVGSTEPTEVQFSAPGLVVREGYAYCGRRFSPGIIVFDIADRESPRIVAQFDLPDGTAGIAGIDGSHLYVRRTLGGLLAFDLRAPESPALAGEVLSSEIIRDIDFRGVTPVAAIEDRGLVTIDFSDPLSPTIVGQAGALDDVTRVRANGTRALALGRYFFGEIALYSIANPAAPTELARQAPEGGFARIECGATTLVATENENMCFLANPFPNVLYRSGRYFEGEVLYGEIATDGELLIAPNGDVVKFIRVNDEVPHVIGVYEIPPFTIAGLTSRDVALHVYAAGAYTYLTTMYRGLQILDTSDATQPRLVSTIDEDIFVMQIRDGLAYALADGFSIYDVSDPIAPRLLGRTPLGGNYHQFFAVEGPLACALGYDGLSVLDVSNPSAPTVTGFAPVDDYVFGLALSGQTAFIATNGSDLVAYDLTDATNPVRRYLRGEFHGIPAGGVVARDGVLYVAARRGLWIGDLTDPLEPRLLARQDTLSWTTGVGLLRDHAAVNVAGPGVSFVSLPLPGDIDSDRDVDLADLGLLLSLFGQFVGGGPGNGDFNCDGWVDLGDLTTLLSTFGTTR
jgi:hypothetical protein